MNERHCRQLTLRSCTNVPCHDYHHDRRSRRRARLCGIYFSLLGIQLVNAAMYVVPNVCEVHKLCRNGQLVDWSGVSGPSFIDCLVVFTYLV